MSTNPIITRDMYDEAKRYVETVLQAGVPLVDADYNDQMDSFYTQLRRVVISGFGDGAPGIGFKIDPTSPPANDFLVRGSLDPDLGPAEMFVKGVQAQLGADEDYLGGQETVPTSVLISGNVLTDTSANFTPGELIGRTLIPNLASPGNTFLITGNTANTITTAVAITGAASGQRYRVKLSQAPAGPPRVDLVYLDCYLEDFGPSDDPNLYHTIGGIQITAMLRKKLRERVLVKEGITLPVSLPSGYTDFNGIRHVQVPLAIITRPGGSSTITGPMITDLRGKIFTLSNLGNLFVQKTGDTMTGPLVMLGDIILASGFKVLGQCIIDGNALCPEVVEQKHFKRDSHLLGVGDAVPTASEVNNPLDPNHFEVHDNRYYTKDQIDSRTGSNLLANGSFEDCFAGWDNAVPSPLSGSPQEEAAKITVSCSLCGAACGGTCGCRVMLVTIPEGNRVCSVCPVRQDVIGVRCGGKFQLIENICVTKGVEGIIPYMLLDLYSSCQYVGTRKVRLFNPTPTHPAVTARDGFVSLSQEIELPACVDQMVMTLCYEILPLAPASPGYYGYGYEYDYDYNPFGPQSPLKCEVGPGGFEFAVCTAQVRRISGVESVQDPTFGCRTNKIPMIERCFDDGRVQFTPAFNQVATVIEVLQKQC